VKGIRVAQQPLHNRASQTGEFLHIAECFWTAADNLSRFKPTVKKQVGGLLFTLIEKQALDDFPHRMFLIVAYLLIHCGLGPREIVHLYPQEFSEVEEIYRLRRNIFERVLRNVDRLPLGD
jgi:hypothetical protein